MARQAVYRCLLMDTTFHTRIFSGWELPAPAASAGAGIARNGAGKSGIHSTQITARPAAWAASRCLASLVMKEIVSPEEA